MELLHLAVNNRWNCLLGPLGKGSTARELHLISAPQASWQANSMKTCKLYFVTRKCVFGKDYKSVKSSLPPRLHTHPLSCCSSGSALWGFARAAGSPQLEEKAEEMWCHGGLDSHTLPKTRCPLLRVHHPSLNTYKGRRTEFCFVCLKTSSQSRTDSHATTHNHIWHSFPSQRRG